VNILFLPALGSCDRLRRASARLGVCNRVRRGYTLIIRLKANGCLHFRKTAHPNRHYVHRVLPSSSSRWQLDHSSVPLNSTPFQISTLNGMFSHRLGFCGESVQTERVGCLDLRLLRTILRELITFRCPIWPQLMGGLGR